MELRQLKYFTQSAELLNFTEAARQLYITQSTLSQQIKQLEDELGILLFDRISRSVRLTEAGRLFLPYALQALQEAENGRHVIDDLKGLVTGELIIGVTYGLSALLTTTIIHFSKKYPQLKIGVQFGTSEELLDKLTHAKVDFLLSFIQTENNELYKVQKLFASPLRFVVAAKHSLAAKKYITLKDVTTIPLALPDTGYNTRKFLDKTFMQQKILPNISLELNDINTLLNLVETGNWCTIMTEAAVKGRQNLKAISIKNMNDNINANVITINGAYQKKAVKEFIAMLMKEAGK